MCCRNSILFYGAVFGSFVCIWTPVSASNIEDRTTPGNVTSPGYPGNYPPLQNVTWNFRAATGKWAVVFEKFELQQSEGCAADYVNIRDMIDWSDSKRYCGDEVPPIFTSRTSWLQIQFRTNWVEELPGFFATVYYGEDAAILEYQLRVRGGKYASRYSSEEPESHKIIRISITSALPLAVALLLGIGSCALCHLFRHRRRDGAASLLATNPRYVVPRNNRSTTPFLSKISKMFKNKKQEKIVSIGLQKLGDGGPVKMVPNPNYTRSETTQSRKQLFVRLSNNDDLTHETMPPPQYTSVKFVDLPPEINNRSTGAVMDV